jgi:hypothetical protein
MPMKASKLLVGVFAVIGVLFLVLVGILFGIKTKNDSQFNTEVAKPKTLIDIKESFKGGEVLFRYTDRFLTKTGDGYSKEIPFKQLDLKIVVTSKDNPNFYWTFMPRKNASEAKGNFDESKDKLEWRQVKGEQTIRTAIVGNDASDGGTFAFWNKNFADPITFEAEVIGTCHAP